MLQYSQFDTGSMSIPAGRTVSSHFAKPNPSSQAGKKLAGVADLTNRLAVALNQGAAKWGIKKRLKDMEPMIEAALSHGHGGVLLNCRCIEWDTQDFAGNRAVSSFDIVIMGYGTSATEVFKAWNSRPQLTAGSPKGWHFKSTLVWAEKA